MFDELLLCDDEREEPERDLDDEERFLPPLLPESEDVSRRATISTAPTISRMVVIVPLSIPDSLSSFLSLSAFEELSKEGFFESVAFVSSGCEASPPLPSLPSWFVAA